MSLRTVMTTRCDADRRIQFVAHVMQERRSALRREADILVAVGTDSTLPGLLAKLSARGYPMPEGVRS